MSETQIPEQEPLSGEPQSSLGDEFTNMGRNLIGILRAAWERPERQKLQQEIEDGLVDLGITLRREAKALSESPVTQKVKTEVEEVGTRVRNAQIDTRVREELIGALHIMNNELAKVANTLSTSAPVETQSSDVPPSDVQGTTVDMEAGEPGTFVVEEPPVDVPWPERSEDTATDQPPAPPDEAEQGSCSEGA